MSIYEEDKAQRGKIKKALEKFLYEKDRWSSSLSGTDAVYRLEKRFASLLGQPHALAVGNATLAFWALFQVLGIREAEIITTAYSWGGSLAGLLLTGNRPVFADIDRQTLTLDPERVKRRITSKTRAILTVDIYGNPCAGPALRKLADANGLLFLQDCAQSFGAYWGGRHTGGWADAAIFSFTHGKALFAGEGGMIVTPHRQIYEELVWGTQHPLRHRRDLPDRPANELAMNARMNPLAAVWAEAAFASALAGVERRREKSLEVIALLEKEGLSRPAPQKKEMKPSFQTLTFEPCGDIQAIEHMLQRRRLPWRVSLPPIVSPLQKQQAFRAYLRNNRWPEYRGLRITSEQCRLRRRLIPFNPF